MRIHKECLPCLINQVVKVANMCKVKEQDALFHDVFAYLSTLDFQKTNPEVIGSTFQMIKQYTGNEDPYLDIRTYYNHLFLELLPSFEKKILASKDPFSMAIRYAIVGNIIDFNPMHTNSCEDILRYFESIEEYQLTMNHIDALEGELAQAKTLLYLGDNCGELCLDKLLIAMLHKQYPNLHIYFGVRGAPVVNDTIAQDAYAIGMDAYAEIIDNGDNSLGTILPRTSKRFQEVYQTCDLVIAKGQANFESLSEEHKNIYFLLMCKCDVIASYLHVPKGSLVCLANEKRN